MVEAQTPPADIPGLPPGTYEYVDEGKKRNWKKIIEVTAVLVIATVPLVLSLFKINTTVSRVYETINPAYVGNSSAYQTWGNIVTVAQKIIQPVTTSKKNTYDQTTPEQNASVTDTSPTSYPTMQPNQTQEQFVYPTQGLDPMTYPVQTQGQPTYPSSNQQEWTYPAQDVPTYTPTPSFTPTPTAPPITIQPSSQPSSDSYATAYSACYGKKNGAECSYTNQYGHIIDGKCNPAYGGYLMCTPN